MAEWSEHMIEDLRRAWWPQFESKGFCNFSSCFFTKYVNVASGPPSPIDRNTPAASCTRLSPSRNGVRYFIDENVKKSRKITKLSLQTTQIVKYSKLKVECSIECNAVVSMLDNQIQYQSIFFYQFVNKEIHLKSVFPWDTVLLFTNQLYLHLFPLKYLFSWTKCQISKN